jgi:F-type H+-transporting ATPase subunit b
MITASSVFLVPNGTFFVELAVTIILIVAFTKWVLPPLNKVMAERQEHIRSALESADKARQDAEAADDQRHAVLEEARGQAREIVATAQQTAEQVRNDAAARGQAEYDRIVAAAAADVLVARQRAVDEAATRLGEIVMEVVTKVVGREIDAAAHRDLIDEAIAALNAETQKGAGQNA